MNDLDELDLLSAIWIIASNDENNLITCEGIRYRLALAHAYDVRALVAKRPELFRLGVSSAHLEEWKQQMRVGKHLPGWIRVLGTQEREGAISDLTSEQIFRSQFRASRNAERSPIEIIRWGLEHLDRMRKAKLEAKDISAKSWQVWLVFATGILTIVTQIVVALLRK